MNHKISYVSYTMVMKYMTYNLVVHLGELAIHTRGPLKQRITQIFRRNLPKNYVTLFVKQETKFKCICIHTICYTHSAANVFENNFHNRCGLLSI